MNAGPNLVSLPELKKLLNDVNEKGANVMIRFRLMGEMWSERFMKVIKVTDSGVFFDDAAIHKYVHVRNLGNLLQFEIDSKWNNFLPFFHYQIQP
jgi:hypothetical protein